MLSFYQSLFCCVVFGIGSAFKVAYDGKGPITGHTPCCMDRLGDVVCAKHLARHQAQFLHKCINNPDFALVQCCKTCHSINKAYFLDYTKNTEALMEDKEKFCFDRRPSTWCGHFVNRTNGWESPHLSRFNCGNVVFAFRVCRKSCGYCTDNNSLQVAKYDYELARDPFRCYNPTYGLAYHNIEFAKVFRQFSRRFAQIFQFEDA